jgi:predicted permease
MLRHHRLYSVAFAGTLALAVAASTASLAVVKRAFLDPLPYPEGDRLVSLLTMVEGRFSAVSSHVLADLQAEAPPLVDFVPIRPEGATYTGEGSTDQLAGLRVTSGFFSTLGATAVHGRTFRDDDRDVVVVSDRFWRQSLGGDPGAVGRSIVLDGVGKTLIGVLAPDFLTPYFTAADFWIPLDLAALTAANPRARRNLTTLARRAPGATYEQIDAYLEIFSNRLQQRFPEIHGQQTWVAKPLRAELVGHSAPVLLGVGAAAALLVLIVAANVAGLSAARALAMRHQTAVRAALGASRGQLLRERLVECLLLALIGSGVGVWLGRALTGFVATLQTDFLDRLAPVSFDWVTAAIGIAIGVGCGVLVAVVSSFGGVAGTFGSLLGASRGTTGMAGQARLRSGLVMFQVALALVLIAGAGLLVRTMANLAATELGFDSERVTTVFLNLPGHNYADTERHVQFEDEVIAGLERIPGVVAATASVGFPVWGGTGAGLAIQGQPTDAGMAEIAYLSLAPNFLRTLGIPILAGRGLEVSDRRTTPWVVVINETMARTHWPAGDALGARVRIGPVNDGPWITVVGIIPDLRTHGPVEPVRPTAFGSTHQFSWPRRHFAVRPTGEVPNLAAQVVATIRAVDPAVAVGPLRSVDEMVSNQTARHRLIMLTLTFFGVVATVLSGLGLYAVVALTSQLRRREYAVRVALGAQLQRVRWLVVRQALVLAVGGAAVGLALAAAGTRTLASLLHGVTPMDLIAMTTAVVVVLGLAMLAAWLPAREAGRVDPAEVLKAE